MTTITFPSVQQYPASATWRLEMPTQTNVSGWTGRRQTLASGRGWWTCQFSLPPLGPAGIKAWRSFIAQMRGGANEARVPVVSVSQYGAGFDANVNFGDASLYLDFTAGEYWSTGGTAAGTTAAVDGAAQTGRSLVTDGWPVSETVLSAGDFVTIEDQLLQLTADVVTDGTGAATISFEPPIRSAPADNAVIEFGLPYALMYLEEVPQWSQGLGEVYALSVNFREAF